MIVFSCVEKENDLFVLDGHTLQEGTQTEHGTVPGHQVLGHRAQGHSEAGHHAGELHHRQEFAVYQSTKNLQ